MNLDVSRSGAPARTATGAAVRPLALLVEDMPDVLITTGRFLEAAGFDVVRACNGEEALQPLESGQQFALLVTDYAMPKLNGLELAAKARERFRDIKVLVITGFPDVEALADLPSGMAFLIKPYKRADLIGQLKAWFTLGSFPAISG